MAQFSREIGNKNRSDQKLFLSIKDLYKCTVIHTLETITDMASVSEWAAT